MAPEPVIQAAPPPAPVRPWPPTEKREIVNTLHGVPVRDDYQWLEFGFLVKNTSGTFQIAAIDVFDADLALIEPFGIATGAQVVARNVFVRITLADGAQGWGEAAPFPAVNGETREHARADRARPACAVSLARAAGLGRRRPR